ncbi:hypothetical protein FE257_012816 [Aspergillus nanangensis]|uniref:Uncharacterized protein n=1 Tax=Aspergillus nanangensis TaxID=2582783 RepID=A0AAD4CFF9_ASPNN|nr:hypothetical protein FE257_012816 [Aspergillus nanangensis]
MAKEQSKVDNIEKIEQNGDRNNGLEEYQAKYRLENREEILEWENRLPLQKNLKISHQSHLRTKKWRLNTKKTPKKTPSPKNAKRNSDRKRTRKADAHFNLIAIFDQRVTRATQLLRKLKAPGYTTASASDIEIAEIKLSCDIVQRHAFKVNIGCAVKVAPSRADWREHPLRTTSYPTQHC